MFGVSKFVFLQFAEVNKIYIIAPEKQGISFAHILVFGYYYVKIVTYNWAVRIMDFVHFKNK